MIPPHTIPWTPALRNAPTVPGGSDPLPVGSTEDIALTHTKFRAFTPEGDSPANGWPCFIFFHGGMSAAFLAFLTYLHTYFTGGWTFGNINSENSFSTNMCIRQLLRLTLRSWS